MVLRRRHLHAGNPVHDDLAVAGPRRPRRAPRLPILALSAITLPLSSGPAAAQVSVEVSPLRVELQTGPGATATQAVTVSNAGTEAVRVRARLTDWQLSRDGSPQFEGTPEAGPYSATDWVRIAPPEQVLPPGKAGTVRFSLAVPADAAAAGYRTAILFEFNPAAEPAKGGRQVQFRSRIATLIYVNVGAPPADVELTDLRIRPAPEQTQVIAILTNTSRRSVRTKGTLTLFDAGGKAVRETTVPDVPVLPESEREVAIPAIEPATPLPAGTYRVEVKIDVGMPALLVGETTLTVPD